MADTRSDASKNMAPAAWCRGKKYMLSLTWNAPMEAFTDKDPVLPRRRR
ncbi:hypothetical protein LNQ52_13415 [Klebsiella pneumoniae subsp. pneumoniae]|nr:hypothetical protein [Klebsiella pneumoniae subsp. pneumoniae]